MCASCDTEMTHIPAMVGQHINAIDINKAGHLFLASSQLTYRYWTGSLWCYTNADVAPDVEKCSTGTEIDNGVGDLKLIGNTNRLVVAVDNGGVQAWEVSEERDLFRCLASPCEHDDYVNSVSVNADLTKITSAGQDRRIKVWDVEEFVSTHTYRAHSSNVHSATFHPKDPHLFISCSQDNSVLLWDLRKPKPASKIDTSFLPAKPSCIQWQPTNDTGIVIGTEDGHLVICDTKQNENAHIQLRPHSRPVTSIVFSPINPMWFASASEDCTSVVTEYSAASASPIFRQCGYNDYVTSVTWHPDGRLFSCGWDCTVQGSVVEHSCGLTEQELIRGTEAVTLHVEAM